MTRQGGGCSALVTVLAICCVVLIGECVVVASGKNSNDNNLVENIVVEKPAFKHEQPPSLIDLSTNMHGSGGSSKVNRRTARRGMRVHERWQAANAYDLREPQVANGSASDDDSS